MRVLTYRTGLRSFTEYLAFTGLRPETTRTSELPPEIAEQFVVALSARGMSKQSIFTYSHGVKSFLKFLFRRRIGLRESSYDLTKLGLSETLGRMEYRAKRIDRRLAEVVERVLALPEPTRLANTSNSSGRPSGGELEQQERGHHMRRLERLRDRALFLTLCCTGARISEIVGLDRSDLDDGRADQALALSSRDAGAFSESASTACHLHTTGLVARSGFMNLAPGYHCTNRLSRSR